MNFLALYDRPDASEAERRAARIARTWCSILQADYNITGIVRRLMDELNHPPEDPVAGGWSELQAHFTAWAVAEEWWSPKLDDQPARE